MVIGCGYPFGRAHLGLKALFNEGSRKIAHIFLEDHEYEEKRRRLPAERAPSLAALAPAHAPTKSAKIAVDSNAPIMSFSNAP